jgi:putative phosphoesterase
MTVLGIVSDTHLPRFGRALPSALIAGLREARVDRILHCGDMTDLLAIDLFTAIAPVDAVAGNNDGDEIRERFGRKKIITVEGVRIGMIHGDRGAHAAPRNAVDAFAGEPVDVICFGHSHRPLREHRGKVLLLNPGSPTDKRMNPRYSYATLRLDGGSVVDAHVHYYADRGIAS